MTSLGSTPRLRTNCRMMLMREKAFQEEQRKRQKIMNSPRGHNSSRSQPPSNGGLSTQTGLFRGSRDNSLDLDMIHTTHQSHLEPILSDDFTPVDSINTPYSLTPSSMTTSVSEYDALFEDINEIVEKESHTNNSFTSEKNDKESKVSMKAPLKTSSSCPTMRAARLTLPSKLDPSDFPDIDTYKKEKHNIVEKKRRYKINDCIQELADLLPQSYDVDLNMKKGYILEKSVEYIQELKKDSDKKRETEGRVRELERENRQLHLELQALKRSQEAALIQQRQKQHQQQQQHQQQFLVVSPGYQSQHRSPHSNPILLALGDKFISTTNSINIDNANHNSNIQQQQHQQQQQQDFHQQAFDFGRPVFVDESFHLPDHEAMEQGVGSGSLLDADALMSNLQVSNELTEMDRQELSGFIDLEELAGEDLLMTGFNFPHPGGDGF